MLEQDILELSPNFLSDIKITFQHTLEAQIASVDLIEKEKIISFSDYLYSARLKCIFGE